MRIQPPDYSGIFVGSTSKDEILIFSILARISQCGLLRCRSTDLGVIVVDNRKGFMAMTGKDTIDCTVRWARPVIVHPWPFMRHAVGSVRINSPPLRFILLSAWPLQTRDIFSPFVDIITSPGDNSCTELASCWALVIVIRHCLRNFYSPDICAIMPHFLWRSLRFCGICVLTWHYRLIRRSVFYLYFYFTRGSIHP